MIKNSHRYKVQLLTPQTHLVTVEFSFYLEDAGHSAAIFLPSWSPGSYLMREYARNIVQITLSDAAGNLLPIKKETKNTWKCPQMTGELTLKYQMYLNELTVRTSEVNGEHAFLHGPSYLMGLMKNGAVVETPCEITFQFCPRFQGIATSLTPIESTSKDEFKYRADNYTALIDRPVEIGCFDSDGFIEKGIPHHLAFFGVFAPHKKNIKADIHQIVKFICDQFGERLPYERYTFITHLGSDLFGGLEHQDSCALHFDGALINDRAKYLDWLTLVAHEYFHTWNIKRIRPVELGPFDYLAENYTTMLWLAEGLTSFWDEYAVFKCGLMTEEEYLQRIKKQFERYFATPGRKFQTLEESSFDAWIKLYRPDENSRNATISYYLKGGLCFFLLDAQLQVLQKSVAQFTSELWNHYLQNPAQGITSSQFFSLLQGYAGVEVRNFFENVVTLPFEPNWNEVLKKIGLELIFAESTDIDLGITTANQGNSVFIREVVIDSINSNSECSPGDEILAINQFRVTAANYPQIIKNLLPHETHSMIISRKGRVLSLNFTAGTAGMKFQDLKKLGKNLGVVAR